MRAVSPQWKRHGPALSGLGAQPGASSMVTGELMFADALVQAAETFDTAALKEILGPDSTDVINTDDAVADKNRATIFATAAKEKMSVDVDSKNSNLATISIGNDNFPVPIPIVKEKGKWHFDTERVYPEKA